ncbi:hypothetical protein ACHMW4_17155 [Mesorhizobium sp. UC22_110]|uniref:hypothetical protein n=1 Tax=Mesorhizobium sp. UC22_110 TaxID=3374552 RepID=UPI003757DE1A
MAGFPVFPRLCPFELIYPAPDDPSKLAIAAGGYWLLSFLLMLVFGYEGWCRRGEFLSVFFSMLARFSPLDRDAAGRLSLCWPGAKLLDAPPLPLSAAAFLLLALSSVSFDGLMRTFFWLGLNGMNPLELPGRTAMIGTGSAGLVATFLLLALLFGVSILAGRWIAGSSLPFRQLSGLLVWSIVPIALAYHIAHYLTDVLVNGQYALVALSDPFALGWDLFGTAHLPVTAGIVAGADAAWWLWNMQAALIVGGHILAGARRSCRGLTIGACNVAGDIAAGSADRADGCLYAFRSLAARYAHRRLMPTVILGDRWSARPRAAPVGA